MSVSSFSLLLASFEISLELLYLQFDFSPVSEKGAGLNLACVYYCLDLTEASTTDIWGFKGRYTTFIYSLLANLKKYISKEIY